MASARAMRAALQKIAERLSPTELTALLSKLLSEHTSESFRSDVDLALSAIVCAMRSVATRIWKISPSPTLAQSESFRRAFPSRRAMQVPGGTLRNFTKADGRK